MQQQQQNFARNRRPTSRPALFFAAAAALLSLCSSNSAGSQTCVRADLPLAPAPHPFLMETAANSTAPAADTDSTGSLSGSVVDGSGALVPGAVVALKADRAAEENKTEADGEGKFHFAHLPSGNYQLTATAPGFKSFSSSLVALNPGEARDSLELSLAISANHVVVEVRVSRRDLANDEVRAAEQQRVLGLFPNFYTSFVPNAAPLDAQQKFGLALHATTDRMAFVTAGLVAAGEQGQNTFPAYGAGASGFAKRYGAAYADGFIGKMLGSALLPSVFRQDPRYFYMGHGTIGQRARHAILSAVIARGDNGRPEPNYSHILGNAAAGAISMLYHPATDSAGRLALDNGLIGILGNAAVNLTREFLLKPFTRGVPVYTTAVQ
ncbi:MAG: carboxypeptidase-like regulatory domain-containing protein [Janthinobacterium lividum]